ncbi:hypothetical protein J6V85_03910 [Candidatus Saccharibacteria bacterium]|nr:hypothetical protein [Candidatus Saccharibacteria bacterium]
MKKTRNHQTLIIIGGFVAVILIGIAAFFGIKAIYDNGISNGRRIEADEIADKLEELGNAISERESFQKNIQEVFKDLPSEVDSEGIDSYIEKLRGLTDNISTENVKSLLEEYYNKWLEFKDVYLGENNDEIANKFEELKTKASELSEKIKATFNDSIKNSLEEF